MLVDVDGTLVDSNYHHTLAWARAFAEHGRQPPLAAIHRLIGMGGRNLVETLIGQPDDGIEDAWRRRFDELLPEVHACDGAAALLRRLHEAGLEVVLATSSPTSLLDAMRARIDADEAVDLAITADDVDRSKPDPEVFQVALEKAGLAPDGTMVIGDSIWDVEAAGRADLQTVAVETGGFSAAELRRAGAVAVYESCRDLVDRFDSSPLAG